MEWHRRSVWPTVCSNLCRMKSNIYELSAIVKKTAFLNVMLFCSSQPLCLVTQTINNELRVSVYHPICWYENIPPSLKSKISLEML